MDYWYINYILVGVLSLSPAANLSGVSDISGFLCTVIWMNETISLACRWWRAGEESLDPDWSCAREQTSAAIYPLIGYTCVKDNIRRCEFTVSVLCSIDLSAFHWLFMLFHSSIHSFFTRQLLKRMLRRLWTHCFLYSLLIKEKTSVFYNLSAISCFDFDIGIDLLTYCNETAKGMTECQK